MLVEAPVLIQADLDKQFYLDTDASGYGIGAALLQFAEDGKLHPVSYLSRNYNQAEKNYNTREQEALAIVWSIQKLDEFLRGRKRFYVITDHSSLKWAAQGKGLRTRVNRWMSQLHNEYDFEIYYRKGIENRIADCLSRYPLQVHNLRALETYIHTLDSKTGSKTDEKTQSLRDEDKKSDKKELKKEDKKVEVKEKALIEIKKDDKKQDFIQIDQEIWRNELQLDEELKEFVRYLMNDANPSMIAKTKRKKFKDLEGHYRIEDGILFHRSEVAGQQVGAVVVPYKFREQVLNEFHRRPESGHLGFRKTLGAIRRCYFWPKMSQDIKRYCAACRQCRMNKMGKPHHQGLMGTFDLMPTKFEIVHIDFVGPLTISSQGNNNILTMMDRATGWIQAYPTEDQTAETAFRRLVGCWIPSYGVPKKIISDQGGAFTSNLMDKISKRYAIKQAFTSAYHPKTNGKLERMHRDLGVYMRIYLENNPGWEDLLPNFTYAHNTAEKDRERYSPAFLVYGQELRHPAQIIDTKILWTEKEDAVGEMLQTLKAAIEIVRKTQERVRVRLEENYNKNRKHVEFKIGEKVYAYENSLGKIKGKFTPRWTGPWIIKTVKANGNAYDLEMDGQKRSVNIDTIIPEEGEFIEEEMKRPPFGEKIEDDMREELEIKNEQDLEDGLDHKYEPPAELDEKKESKEENIGEKVIQKKEDKKEKKENAKRDGLNEDSEDESDDKGKEEVKSIKPLELKRLPIQNIYKTEDIKLGHYAIIQSDNTRYLVSIWEQYGEKFEGHYLLSREKQGPLRRYSKAFWDYNLGKIQIGGKKGKSNRIVPLTVPFAAKDIYYTFRRLEVQRIPKEIRDKWIKEYGQNEVMCNKLTVNMINDSDTSARLSSSFNKTKSRGTRERIVI
jgi:hypothetical protein